MTDGDRRTMLTYVIPDFTETQADRVFEVTHDACEGHAFLREIDCGATLGGPDGKLELDVFTQGATYAQVVAELDELVKSVLVQDLSISGGNSLDSHLER